VLLFLYWIDIASESEGTGGQKTLTADLLLTTVRIKRTYIVP